MALLEVTDIQKSFDATQVLKGVSFSLDAGQVRAATVEWLSPMGNDAQTEFAQKLELVDTMCLELIHKDGSSLLQDAGYESSAYPWDDAAYEKYTAVLDALGAEQG